MPSLRTRAGALLYDWPRYRRAMRSGHWELMHNRNERITTDGRGVRCEWRFTSDLHIAKVFPATAARLMRAAFSDWPVALRDSPVSDGPPKVGFVIGHRGLDRLPHLLMTLRSIAGQEVAAVECIVVEQSAVPQIEDRLPSWVRYVHTPIPREDYPYNRAWTLNEGVRVARADIVVLHDNDMIVPRRYAAECATQIEHGRDFLDLKRFTFYLDEAETGRVFASGEVRTNVAATVVQNLQGASIAARRAAYSAIGGFDEEFVGWGGEDNDFWDRAATTGKVYQFGYLPMIHLFHPPQPGKLQGTAPGLRRYQELAMIPPEERIERLKRRRSTGGQ